MSKVWGERFAIVPDAVLMAPVSANAKVLWAILARYADPEGHCYPSLATLAEILGVSVDTVRRAKKELLEAALLVAEEHYDTEGRRTADSLFLLRPPGNAATPAPSNAARANKKGDSEVKDINTSRARERKSAPPPFSEPQSRYPELKRPAREQRILDGPWGPTY